MELNLFRRKVSFSIAWRLSQVAHIECESFVCFNIHHIVAGLLNFFFIYSYHFLSLSSSPRCVCVFLVIPSNNFSCVMWQFIIWHFHTYHCERYESNKKFHLQHICHFTYDMSVSCLFARSSEGSKLRYLLHTACGHLFSHDFAYSLKNTSRPWKCECNNESSARNIINPLGRKHERIL